MGSEKYYYFLGIFSNFLMYFSFQILKSDKDFNFVYAGILRGMGFIFLNGLISSAFDNKVYEIDRRSFWLLILRNILITV